jgi:TRAP-type uncharacterized transport system substrate-binding protein
MSTIMAACVDRPVELRFARPVSQLDQPIAVDLAELFTTESNINLVLSDNEMSGEEALDAIVGGNIDIALVSNALPYRDGIATVIPLFPSVLHVGYVGERDATDVKELLAGARVFAGEQGSASRRMFIESVEQADIPPETYAFVDDPNPENPVDVFVIFAPIAPDRLRELQEQVPIRLFSRGSPDDIGRGSSIDAATLLNPFLEPFVIPVGTYGAATPEPILTVAVDKVLVTRRDMPEAVIYEFISELLRFRPALNAKRPGLFSNLSGDFDPGRSTFVLHDGAQSYLERAEPTIYERYSGVAEVVVTVMVALFSAAFGGMRLYRMKRKNRIDAFYSDVIAIRKQAERATRDDECAELIDKLKRLQDRAFEQLVDEKLAADESFRIFITLSNDVLRQLGAGPVAQRTSDD